MLLSELTFGSFLTYTPRPETSEQKNSKDWMYALKLDRTVPITPSQLTTHYLSSVLARDINESPIKDILGSSVTLVPMPQSSLPVPGGLWIPQRLTTALVDLGLGQQASPILKRIKAIPKSAYSASGERPTAQTKYETLRADRLLIPPERIVIIDDIITTGASMIGAASVLAESFPNAQISGFAMIRTISNTADFVKLINPCVGTITRRGDSTWREP